MKKPMPTTNEEILEMFDAINKQCAITGESVVEFNESFDCGFYYQQQLDCMDFPEDINNSFFRYLESGEFRKAAIMRNK